MRILADQDVYKVTIDRLREWDHNVITAKEIGMEAETDLNLLKEARRRNCVFITRDKGFGSLIFLNRALSAGVILLRIDPVRVEEVHRELQRVLEEHNEEELKSLFCVVEPHRHRIRRLS
jgi:predicted nuclease of predicted toxin-antitoxin system